MLAAAELAGEPDGARWSKAVRDYHTRCLCRPSWPGPAGLRSVYLEPSNGGNALPPRLIPAHEQLIHVASLNQALRRLVSGEHVGAVDLRLRFPELVGRPFPERAVGSGFQDLGAFGREVDQIAAAVNGRGADTVRELVAVVFDALGDTQPPWWACFAQEASTFVAEGKWIELCRALGVGHFEAGDWLIVFRYRVGLLYELGPGADLYRPTVVEASDNPHHFPSPPLYRFGVAMPLGEASGRALREVIHPPLRGKAVATACAEQLRQIAIAPLADHNRIIELRRRHRERLAREFENIETMDWLARHPEKR